MAANSFTWSLTTSGSSGSFTTPADWVSVNNGNANTPNFTLGTNDFSIITAGSVSLTVTGLSGVNIDSLTVDDPGADVIVGAAQNTFGTGLTLNNGLITAHQDNSAIAVGVGSSAGAIVVGAGGVIDAGSASFGGVYVLKGSGTATSTISGSGTVIADGYLQLNAQLAVSSSALTFDIADNGPTDGSNDSSFLEFDGSVGTGETVNFLGNSGYLILASSQVGTGSTLNNATFGATVSGLAVSPDSTPLNLIDIGTNNNNGPSGLTAALSGTNNDILTLTDGAHDNYVINLSGNYTGDVAMTAPDPLGLGIDVFLSSVCYGAGTAVMVPGGEVAIETVQAGDTIVALVDGQFVPRTVKWVGHRELNLNLHPHPELIAPVRVRRNALGENLPRRDLVLSPDHCLFIDGKLFPAKLLVNDMTIVRDQPSGTVSYHHVELERHSVMFAEGVAAESYLDTGNRAFFSNAGLATILHPELTINENLRFWATDACAPLTVEADAVKPVWQRFTDRAVALGHATPMPAITRDADVHLAVDGKVVRPLSVRGKSVSFMVPADAKSVRLVSRATRPNTLTPWLDDQRKLGIAVRSVTIQSRNGEDVLSADHPALHDGWHAAERDVDGAVWRWTAGDAALPVTGEGPCLVQIELSDTSVYLAEGERLAA